MLKAESNEPKMVNENIEVKEFMRSLLMHARRTWFSV